MTDGIIEEIREQLEKATPGPWFWWGQRLRGDMYLGYWGSPGKCTVMNFVRQGTQGAQPRFRDTERDLMVKAENLAIKEAPYREDIVGIDHPDAKLIANAPSFISYLLECIDDQDKVLQSKTIRDLLIQAVNKAELEEFGQWVDEDRPMTSSAELAVDTVLKMLTHLKSLDDLDG